MNRERKIADMTLGELLDAIDEHGRESRRPRTVHGLRGIMELYGVSKSTAARIKKSGVLDDAIFQLGRVITIDVDKALAIKPC